MDQHQIEARPDWHQIAISVPCPVSLDSNGVRQGCGAAVGQMCVEHLAGTPRTRADFHAGRKVAARLKWEADHARESSTIGREDTEAGSDGLRSGAERDDQEGTADLAIGNQPEAADDSLQGDGGGTESSLQGEDAADAGDAGVAQDNQLGVLDRDQEDTGDIVQPKDVKPRSNRRR
jgi:hypothetical protein